MMIAITVLLLTSIAVNAAKPQKEQKRYRFTFDGDITGFIETENGSHGAMPRYQVGTSHGTGKLTFGSSYLGYEFQPTITGEDCFPSHETGGGIHVNWDRGKDWTSSVVWFHGLAGDTSILYKVQFFHDGFFSNSEPTTLAIGASTSFTADLWEINSEGKGKLRKVSCVGDGLVGAGGDSPFPSKVEIIIERIELLD
jgi:hypothetical protein